MNEQPIETTKSKASLIIFALVLLSVFLLFVLWSAVETTSTASNTGLEQAYREMVARQVVSEWECIPYSHKQDREKFILSLMDRFAPEDKKIIEEGRVWKEVLKRKQDAGTLTVSEREKLNSGYYYMPPDGVAYSDENMNYQIKIQRGNFRPPSCPKEMGSYFEHLASKGTLQECDLPYMKVGFAILDRPQDFEVVYEDEYSRWQLYGQNWFAAIGREYERLSKDHRVEALIAEYYDRHDRLQQKAKEAVAKMDAANVVEEEEEKLIEATYRQLSCSGTP